MLALLTACTEPEGGAAETADTGDAPITGYDVVFSTAPDPAVAGEEAEFTLTVRDQLGRPVEDVQQSHERMVHTLLISRDLASFQHLHHEDFYELTADELRDATYRFPVTFPLAGEYFAVFDFAHQNAWQQDSGFLDVSGSPSQAAAPTEEFSASTDDGAIHAELTWDIEPVALAEAAFTLTLTDESGDVTDITPWLGADGHAAIVDEALTFATHTHAWFPDMDKMTPSMEMPHLYSGPTLPFHTVFPAPGVFKFWVQFARESDPDAPFTLPFMVEVAG
jgi:hypothetical protein